MQIHLNKDMQQIIKSIVNRHTGCFFDNVLKNSVSTEYGYQFFETPQDTLIRIGQELKENDIEFDAVADDYFVGHLKRSEHKIIKQYLQKAQLIPHPMWLSKYQDVEDTRDYVNRFLSLVNIDQCLVDKNTNSSILAFFESINSLGIDFCIDKKITEHIESLSGVISVDKQIIMQYVNFGFDFNYGFLLQSKLNKSFDFQEDDYWKSIMEKSELNKIRNNYLRLNMSVENKKFENTPKVKKI